MRAKLSINAPFWFAVLTIGNLLCGWWFVGFFTQFGENIERRTLLATAAAGPVFYDN